MTALTLKQLESPLKFTMLLSRIIYRPNQYFAAPMKHFLILATALFAAHSFPLCAEEQIVERGPHNDLHRRVDYLTSEDGATNEVVSEWSVFQSGLNFWSET